MTSPRQHWDQAYRAREVEELGWYEPSPELSLEMIRESGVGPQELILDVGAGASSLLGHLYRLGYRRLAALDISAAALERNRAALPDEAARAIRWIEADLTASPDLSALGPVALWHDRATLHFLRDPAARAAYRSLLMETVGPGGHAVIATFAPDGATHCSGLEVQRYGHADQQALLGDEWHPRRQENWIFTNPRGEPRSYRYGLYRRVG